MNFKKAYQLITDKIKDENCDTLAYSHSSLNRCKNYVCQLLNRHGVHDIRQTDIRTAELQAPGALLSSVE
jgi:hypothetical protein